MLPPAGRCSSASARRSARTPDRAGHAHGPAPCANTDAAHRAAASSLAAMFTPSPCRSVPSGITSPMLMPMRKRMRRSGGWSPSYTGTCCCTLTAQRTAPSMLSNAISSRVAAGLHHPAAVFADRWVDQARRKRAQAVAACRHRPGRSAGCSRPCRHRRQQSACGRPRPCRRGQDRCLSRSRPAR